MNKNRNKNKWILPKNNKSIKRHRLYVKFVCDFCEEKGFFPTEKEYKDGIVPYLQDHGVNSIEKKTSPYHQLYQPIFFGMLEKENEKIIPTKLGYCLWLDSCGDYIKEIIFLLFNNATFATGTMGSCKIFDNIMPIRELLNNLMKYNELSFYELNRKFYSSIPNIDVKTEKDVDDEKKEPKWAYILSMLKEVCLIESDGNILKVSSKELKYNANSKIFATKQLKKIMGSKINLKQNVISKFNLTNFNNLIWKNTDNYNVIESEKRDSLRQSEYRQKLLKKHSNCQMCGIKNEKLLIASHIKPYSKCDTNEKFDENNGFLLCVMHDALFDKGLITLKNGELIYSESIGEYDRKIITQITYNKIYEYNCEVEEYLKFHNSDVFIM